MFIPFPKALSVGAIVGFGILATACGSGGPAPSTGNAGSQGSAAPASPGKSTPAKPAAPKTTAPAGTGGSAAKCSDLNLSVVADALGGSITPGVPDGSDSMSWSGGNYGFQCSVHSEPWPPIITDEFVIDLPSPPGPNGLFAKSSSSPKVGAFYPGGGASPEYIGMILQSGIDPTGAPYPIDAKQQGAVRTLMGSMLG